MPEQNGRHAEYAPQGDKGGTSPAMEHRANAPSNRPRMCERAAGAARPTHLPLSRKVKKKGAHPPMEHGAKTKAETTPPDRAKKGWENMKSGH